jgi:hypothetical protein
VKEGDKVPFASRGSFVCWTFVAEGSFAIFQKAYGVGEVQGFLMVVEVEARLCGTVVKAQASYQLQRFIVSNKSLIIFRLIN